MNFQKCYNHRDPLNINLQKAFKEFDKNNTGKITVTGKIKLDTEQNIRSISKHLRSMKNGRYTRNVPMPQQEVEGYLLRV